MRNIIVFGNVPLATWTVEKILDCKEYNLLGVVCDKYPKKAFENHGMAESDLYRFCEKNSIKILSFDAAFDLAQEIEVLGISVRYHKLFKKEYYSVFSPGIINLHGGELPRFRGANIANYAILENVSRGGGTLHYINEGIDEGAIVERVLFEVTGNLTAFEYFSETILALKDAFTIFINRQDVIDSTKKIKFTAQSDYIANGENASLYFKKGIEKRRIMEFDNITNWNEIYRLARAFTFPGHKGFIIKNGDEFIEVKAIKSDSKS